MDIKVDKEFSKIRRVITLKAILKILIYSLIIFSISMIFIDIFFNDYLADMTVKKLGRDVYYLFVANKPQIVIGLAIIIFGVTSYWVILNMNNSIIETIMAMDKILKNPEEEIKMSNGLEILESRINNIRADLIKNQNKAKEAMQKKDNLIMYMAHDLKTPLTSIIGYLTLLQEEKEISTNLREKYINIALNKAHRVEELTNEFFDITRYNLQDMQISKKEIDISYLFDQLIEECYPMLQDKKLRIVVNKPKKIIYFGDGDKLARAFENIIKNAINYCYENSEIEINIIEKSSEIYITIKNKGDKIPKYKLDKIFEQFYRVDESRKSKTGGAGLGLAITKKIIEMHDGKISVKNDNEYIEFEVVL